jgi:hypothetical protein
MLSWQETARGFIGFEGDCSRMGHRRIGENSEEREKI